MNSQTVTLGDNLSSNLSIPIRIISQLDFPISIQPMAALSNAIKEAAGTENSVAKM